MKKLIRVAGWIPNPEAIRMVVFICGLILFLTGIAGAKTIVTLFEACGG